ncbi:MAG: pilus assembly protein [Pseudomonadales bacterium]
MMTNLNSKQQGLAGSKKQRGSVLAISLIILLILTVLGVNSMSALTLEERMASHARQSMVASQAAEIAVRAAETWLANTANVNASNMAQFWDGTAGLYSRYGVLNAPVLDVFDDGDWDNTNSVEVNGVAAIDPDGPKGQLVAQNPRYMIEYLGRVSEDASQDSLDIVNSQQPDVRDYAFRITAVGWGENTNARYLVQSTFRITL